MKISIVISFVVIALSIPAHAGETITDTSQSHTNIPIEGILLAQAQCVRMFPPPIGQIGFRNNCDKCRKAAVSWCDGTIKKVDVPPYGETIINSCIGTMQLIGDGPC